MKLFYWNKGNFGDVVAPHIVEHFWKKCEPTEKKISGKLLSIGSIVSNAKENDIIWGSGLISDKPYKLPKNVDCLSVRGPLTKEIIGCETNIFGDLGLLLPKIYNPQVKKTKDIGFIPHFKDKRFKGINIKDDWKSIIREIKKCKKIVSSSLHGIVAAEAYGIPAIWIKPCEEIIGGEFKFQDYFLGTGREKQTPVELEDVYSAKPIPKIKNIRKRRKDIIDALDKYQKDIVYVYKKNKADTIKYSLHTTKNIPHRKIFIIGNDPKVKEIDYTVIPCKDDMRPRELNIKKKLLNAIKDKRISENFILMNDDFYILKPTTLKYYNLGLLEDWVIENRKDKKHFNSPRWYSAIEDTFKKYPNGYFCEVHYPIVLNKKKLNKVIKEIPESYFYLLRTYYCNKYDLVGEESCDFKAYNVSDLKDGDFISTAPSVEKEKGFINFMDNKIFGKVNKTKTPGRKFKLVNGEIVLK